MSNQNRKVTLEYTVKGHPTKAVAMETNLPELEIIRQFVQKHWPEGHGIPLHINVYEERAGEKVKTHSYDQYLRQR